MDAVLLIVVSQKAWAQIRRNYACARSIDLTNVGFLPGRCLQYHLPYTGHTALGNLNPPLLKEEEGYACSHFFQVDNLDGHFLSKVTVPPGRLARLSRDSGG